MTGQLPISFIVGKVRDLENALFFSMSDAVLKIPSCVIKVLETDELGQLWFMIPKPPQSIYAFDKTFPVELDFFRKGRDYYLKVFGKAFLVNDPEEINSAECLIEPVKQQARQGETILIRVQISHAAYSEKANERTSAKTLINQVKHKLYQWFQHIHPETTRRIPVQIKHPSISSFSN